MRGAQCGQREADCWCDGHEDWRRRACGGGAAREGRPHGREDMGQAQACAWWPNGASRDESRICLRVRARGEGQQHVMCRASAGQQREETMAAMGVGGSRRGSGRVQWSKVCERDAEDYARLTTDACIADCHVCV